MKINRKSKGENVNKWDAMLMKLVDEGDKDKPKVEESMSIEEKTENRLNWYYMKYHAQDLIILGRIPEHGLNYEKIVDWDLQTIFSVYCAQGKNFSYDFVRNEFEKGGLDWASSSKLFAILQKLRKQLPKDISEEEMESNDITRELPQCVCKKYGYDITYRATFRTPELLTTKSILELPKKRHVEDLTQLTESTLADEPTRKRLSSVSTQEMPSQDSDVSSLIIYGNSSKLDELRK